MPKSKGRKRSTRRPYVPVVEQPKRPSSSPRWYGGVVMGLIGGGVLLIVLNYMGLVPGGTTQLYLWVGLGAIAAGFVAATNWR